MATDERVQCVTLIANADLSAAQYKFVTVNSSAKVAVSASAGGDAVGVLYNDPDEAGKAATVAIAGCPKVVAGAAITAGSEVQTDASGQAITALATDIILGVALESAAASGDVIRIAFQKNGVKA